MSRITAFWKRLSLRAWLAIGMTMTLVPIFTFTAVGYLFHHKAIVQPLVEVSSQQRHILQPLQAVRLGLGDVSETVIDFAIDGQARRLAAFRRETAEMDSAFARLVGAVRQDVPGARDVRKALDDWREVSALAGAIVADEPMQVNAVAGGNIEALVAGVETLDQRLAAIYDDMRVANEHTHDQALVELVRSERWTIAGFVASICLAVLGVIVINRSLVTSMDQLTIGALRLATGDREHQVEVHIPRELVNVANAFNLMANQILKQEEALALAATTDGLTGLLNRREFDRMMAEEIRRSQRYGASVSLIIGDIDRFKAFNDTHGHQAGDEALRAVAKTMMESARDVDRVCRFGGEEFVVILPACDAVGARQAAERTRVQVENLEIALDGGQVTNITISLGVATCPGNGITPESLLKSADEALYKSKANGRNRVTSA